MASKAKKILTSTPAASGKSTPISSGAGHRSTSPLSPTRTSRLQEKAELQCLNDRLAVYIDRARQLEAENSRLSLQQQTTEETVRVEVTNIKQMYDVELSDARKMLDETARDKARLEIDLRRISDENADLKARLDKKTKDFNLADSNARLYESRHAELQGKYSTAVSERKKLADDLKELEKELEKLRKQLDAKSKNLEEETLTRIDLENTLQSLREELSFKDGMHQQELTETRSRRQIELSEIDGRLTEQYEEKLRESLQELRDHYEAQMRANRDEVDALYDSKIKNLQNALNASSNQAASAYEEMRVTKTKIDGLNGRIRELEGTNASLLNRIKDLEALLEMERSNHSDLVRGLENELMRLRNEMTHQLQEYQDLMDIKISLDMEIAAYDKLLSGEECRLNITSSRDQSANVSQVHGGVRSASRAGRRTPSRAPSQLQAGIKRKRTFLEETEERSFNDYAVTASAKGDIEITDCCGEGKYVKVHNKGDKEVHIGGWQLIRTVGDNETNFKFHRSVKVDAGATVTVWSTDIPNVNHEPPSSIVMNGKKWFVGDQMKTALLNGDGEEMATSERVKQQLTSVSQRHRELGTGLGGDDYYHHSQLRSASRASSYGSGEMRGTEKCRVM